MILEVFNLKNNKIYSNSMFGLLCVTKITKCSLKICISYMVYHQIWLNLLKYDHQFMIATLVALKKKSLTETLMNILLEKRKDLKPTKLT